VQTLEFDPQPLLQVMADSIVADYGRQAGVKIAERAISKLCSSADGEALQIWLNVHALLHARPILSQAAYTLH
jgi:hypothetical protein